MFILSEKFISNITGHNNAYFEDPNSVPHRSIIATMLQTFNGPEFDTFRQQIPECHCTVELSVFTHCLCSLAQLLPPILCTVSGWQFLNTSDSFPGKSTHNGLLTILDKELIKSCYFLMIPIMRFWNWFANFSLWKMEWAQLAYENLLCLLCQQTTLWTKFCKE
jgi:hypothetical protein